MEPDLPTTTGTFSGQRTAWIYMFFVLAVSASAVGSLVALRPQPGVSPYANVYLAGALLAWAAFLLREFFFHRYTFTIGPDGFHESPRHKPGEIVPWSRVAEIRPGRAVLRFYSSSGEVLGRLYTTLETSATSSAWENILRWKPLTMSSSPAVFRPGGLILWSMEGACAAISALFIEQWAVGAASAWALLGLALPIGIWMSAPNRLTRIAIDHDGVVLRSIFGTRRIAWSDVSSIEFARTSTWQTGGPQGRMYAPCHADLMTKEGRRIVMSPMGTDWLGIKASADAAFARYRAGHPLRD